MEERLAQAPKEPAPAPKKPPVKRRRGNPLRQEPDMDQEGLISFFETPGDE